LVVGWNGLVSGSGRVIADLQSALFQAVKANDLATARAVNDRIYPLAKVFYADPWADMHNRMKEALVLLGRLPRAAVRPPLVSLSRAEIVRIPPPLLRPPRPEPKAAAAYAVGSPRSLPGGEVETAFAARRVFQSRCTRATRP